MSNKAKVKKWYLFNEKTRLFWKDGGGWGQEPDACVFTPTEKEDFSNFEDGTWIPYIAGALITNDQLIDVLSLFPKGTPIMATSNHADHRYNNVKIFGTVLSQETLKDAEGDTDPEARLFIHISAF